MHLHMQMSRMGCRPLLHSLLHMITMFETLHQSGIERLPPTPFHQALSFPDVLAGPAAFFVLQKPEHRPSSRLPLELCDATHHTCLSLRCLSW